jgi:ribose 5-phosphate isomerase B
MRIGIAADHGGFPLKEQLVIRLKSAGHEVADFGAYQLTPEDDYPDFVIPLGQTAAARTMGYMVKFQNQQERYHK